MINPFHWNQAFHGERPSPTTRRPRRLTSALPQDQEPSYEQWQSLLERAASQQPPPSFWADVDILKDKPASEAVRRDGLKALMRRYGLWF